MTDEARRAVLRQSVSVAVATGLYGISFGALSVVAGLSTAQTMALSLLMFSGGSQFAFIGVVGAGGAAAAAIATAGLLGARNGLYGPQVAPLLGVHGWRKPLAAQLTIDESTAVATAQSDRAAGGSGSGGPVSASSSCGTRSRCSAPWSATGSATRGATGSTPPPRPRSSHWSGRACRARAATCPGSSPAAPSR